MQRDRQPLLIQALQSKKYLKRLRRARLFERLGGPGIARKIQRIVLTPNIYLPYVLYAKSGISHDKLFSTTLFWGRSIKIPLRDYDALALHMFGFAGGNDAEFKLTKFLAKNLGPDDVLYDIGANCGFYTYLGLELCKEVHTFEPIAILADAIQGNVHKDEVATINKMALSEKSGSIEFYVVGSSGLSTLNESVAKAHAPTQGMAEKITVPTMTLDDYVANHTKPTVLKIDAEGAEEQIIKGGATFFATYTPTIAMEIWGKENKWELSMKAADMLRGMGYRSFRLNSNGEPEEATGDLSVGVQATGADNFIFRK
jgi:FkbM family methyltransferase